MSDNTATNTTTTATMYAISPARPSRGGRSGSKRCFQPGVKTGVATVVSSRTQSGEFDGRQAADQQRQHCPELRDRLVQGFLVEAWSSKRSTGKQTWRQR